MTATQNPAQDVSDALRKAAIVLELWEGEPDETGYMGDFNDAAQILLILADHAARELQRAQVVGESDQGSWMGQALHDFTEYFAKNYPQGTEIYDPTWHAPKIFRNALWHIEQAQKRDATPQSSAPVVGDDLDAKRYRALQAHAWRTYEVEASEFDESADSLIQKGESALTGRGSP